jgi:hypothetical protein
MATPATNPFRTSDLVSKYGWQAMIYLAALGIDNLAEAQLLFVDAIHTNALDADDTEHGHSFEKPLATVDYAIGLCEASEEAIILLAPGHYEDYDDSTTGFDADVAGIKIIGLGRGSLKARFDFDHTSSKCVIGANDVQIKNVIFRPGAPVVAIGLEIESGFTGCSLEDVDFDMGEAGNGDDEFVKAVRLVSANHDTEFKNVKILVHADAGGATHAIYIDAASDRLVFQNVIIDGPWATGGIVEDATGVSHILENCAVDVSGTNYSFDGSSTFAKRVNNVDGQVREDDSESLIVEARGSLAYPSGITDESIWAYLLSKSAIPSATSYDNELHSLEALRDAIDAVDPSVVSSAVPLTPTEKSLQDILSELDGANTYDNTTDSLEAISNLLRDDVDVLAGINLDHLAKTSTGISADGELDGHITALSILGHIMATDADPSNFNASTDSLQAIAAAVTGFTTAVSTTPTARSVQDILEKDGSGSFLAADDSLEAISDLLRTGTVVLAGLNLDHFMLTAVVDEQDMSAEIATGSALAHILVKAAGGDVNDFDPTTDSLQAIRDNQQTAALAAIDSRELNYLLEIDGTAAYPENCATDSIIAKICSVGGAADPSTYNNTTDSLEALSNILRTDITLGAGIQLDHLQAVDTGVVIDGDLEAFAVAGSLMAHIMSATKDVTDFNCSTDSLEAISVALAAGTGASVALDGDQLDHLVGTTTSVAAGSDLETYCVSGSLMAHVLSVAADVTTFDCRTDSLEVLSDKIGPYTFDGGGDDEDDLMSHLDLILTDTNAILVDTAVIDPGAKRLQTRTLTDWGATTVALWTVSAPVKAKIWGVVLVGVDAQATNLKISGIPTAPGGTIDITADLDCNNDAVGTVYKMNTTLGGAMIEVTGGVTIDDGIEVILPAGTVIMTSSANETSGGSIQWFCQYEPLEAGATVSNT